MTSDRIPKRERSRIRIMHAAKGLFEEHGIDNVTFQMIADKSEMCRTTIFNHFSGIEDLMLALSSQEIMDIKGSGLRPLRQAHRGHGSLSGSDQHPYKQCHSFQRSEQSREDPHKPYP